MTPYAVLIGPPGAGKSTIGRRVAAALELELCDTDVMIERSTGRTIADIFSHDGEPAFRSIEEQVVAEALATHTGVVSLGGGSILSERTRALLAPLPVVYLEISVAEGLRRTGANSSRPLLAGPDPRGKYQHLMRTRRPLYRSVATIRVRTDGRSPARVVGQVVAKLKHYHEKAGSPNG
ncbi:MAG: shikimate kinase [Rhodococcus sp. (in: high G+C Gram-positive bacteria)]|jgi:shikimate kinase|uniref:shikimate kinase n=1 Tax=Rhodococcus sp. EPR-157 TaxID=1813677 RepID=UPI0007BB2470|nr:shikimate kinase [Rhodococcus sp. EPR-157]KZF05093.1 shikimate kinase [Rhodococcus sp. EPR-157]